MRSVFKQLKRYRTECIMAPLFKLLEAGFDLCVPIVVKLIMDIGIKNGDSAYVVKGCLVLAALGLIGLACAVTAQYFAAKAAVGTACGVRKELFAHLSSLSFSEADKLGRASMITRMTSDVNQLQSGINLTLRLFLRSPIIVFGAALMAFTINVRGALTFTVVIPVLAAIVFSIILAGIPLYLKTQSKLDMVTALTGESLKGARVIRAFNSEEREIGGFREANREHNKALKFSGKISALMNPLTYVTVNAGIIAIVYISGIEISSGNMSQGDLFAMYNYMSQILVELVKMATTIFTMTKAVACGHRIQAVLDTPTGMPACSTGASGEGNADEAVRFDGVSLNYSGTGDNTLDGISFSVMAGSTVGIIGGTGSGKSSLVGLIPRFYDVSSGSVSVFGRDVRDHDVEELRSLVGIVPQKAVLFCGTVRSNLLMGNGNATDDDMLTALRAAQALDFVEEKGGLDAPVEQLGRNFSGGQRQRLTIARALVRRPRILILDDSASALDLATEARLRKALRELDFSPTVFIISQRTSSIRHADNIVVLENGRAVGIGTHGELLERCLVYREIYDSQFKGGEE